MTGTERTILRLDPVGLFAVVGAIVAFVLSGAIRETVYVALGALIGAGLGWVVRRVSTKAVAFDEAVDLSEHATRGDLERTARELGIEGRSRMTKDELVREIARTRQ